MLNAFKMSGAASIALHTMVVLAANSDRPLTSKDIVSVLEISQAHLSKVMQRLVKVGMIVSTRGPGGGFELNSKDNTKLLDIYEAIDGELVMNDCLFKKPVCGKKKCIFDKLLKCINRDFYKYLSQTGLNDLVKGNGGKQWKIS